MKRRDVLKATAMGSLGLVSSASFSFGTGENKTEFNNTKMKKYTNEYFYDNGVLNPEKALNAYKELMAFYHVPFDAVLEKNMFISDFGLGDFANVGMGRNVFQSEDPAAMIQAVSAVVHEDLTPIVGLEMFNDLKASEIVSV